MQSTVSILRWCLSLRLTALQGAQRIKADVSMGLIQLHVTTFLTVTHPAFDSSLRHQRQHTSRKTGSYSYYISLQLFEARHSVPTHQKFKSKITCQAATSCLEQSLI